MSPFPHFAVLTSHILISANKGVFDAGFEIVKKVVGSTLMLLDPWIIPPASYLMVQTLKPRPVESLHFLKKYILYLFQYEQVSGASEEVLQKRTEAKVDNLLVLVTPPAFWSFRHLCNIKIR